jgi:hypothetical protein
MTPHLLAVAGGDPPSCHFGSRPNGFRSSSRLTSRPNSKLKFIIQNSPFTTDPGRRRAEIPEDDNNHGLGDAPT